MGGDLCSLWKLSHVDTVTHNVALIQFQQGELIAVNSLSGEPLFFVILFTFLLHFAGCLFQIVHKFTKNIVHDTKARVPPCFGFKINSPTSHKASVPLGFGQRCTSPGL